MTALTLAQRLGITPQDRQLRFDWIALTDRESALIRDAARYVEPYVDEIVRKFYDHSFKFEAFTKKLAEAGSSRQRLETTQKQYLRLLLEAKFDDAYFEHRLIVGAVHARLHVEPRWNLGNYGMYLQLITDVLSKKMKGDKLRDTLLAFQKAFTLDMTLVIESYIQGLLDRLVSVNETLEASSNDLRTGSNQAHIATNSTTPMRTTVASSIRPPWSTSVHEPLPLGSRPSRLAPEWAEARPIAPTPGARSASARHPL